MITITKKTMDDGWYYDFVLVKNDTGQFVATPKVNGEPYTLQEGDEISFRVSRNPETSPILEVIADENNRISITEEQSKALALGDYYCDITLNYAGGNKDTFIKIPISKKKAISNFHVTYGV